MNDIETVARAENIIQLLAEALCRKDGYDPTDVTNDLSADLPGDDPRWKPIWHSYKRKAEAALREAGYISPAEAQALAQAAEAKGIERAAKKAEQVLDDDQKKYVGSSVTIVGSIPREIRALSPEPGPWRQVPEGYCVDDNKLAGRILTELGISHDPSLEPGSDYRREKIAELIGAEFMALRAMIGAGEKQQ